MTIWYLQHSGFAVDTGNHLLVFDYYIDLPRGGTLEQGAVTPALLRDKPMAVFASHNHHDHFNPIILDWKRQYPDISLYLGDDIPPREEAKTVPPGLTVEENGLTITALRSTDQGVAFVVECDDIPCWWGPVAFASVSGKRSGSPCWNRRPHDHLVFAAQRLCGGHGKPFAGV